MASLLIGNGINYLGDNVISWEALLKKLISDINKSEVIKLEEKPYLHVYEEIYTRALKYANTTEKELKQNIANELKNIKPNEYHNKIMALNFENILTTNYDYNLTPNIQKNNNEREYSLYRFQEVGNIKVWHIHGELNAPNSIMLGYDQYMRSIGRMQKYLKDNQNFLNEVSQSWIDIFFTQDIYIVGLGLDFGEIDLWWLLSSRNRKQLEQNRNNLNKITYINIKDSSRITNKREEAKLSMLEAFGVKIKNINLKNKDYKSAYDDVIKYIESEL